MLTSFKRVLCPVQFDQNSVTALGMAKEIAQKNSGKLFVLHVLSPQAFQVGGGGITPHDKNVAKQEMARLTGEKLGDAEHKAIVLIGNPAEEIVRGERHYCIDLVVMATHGRTGVSHLVLGSVAERVVRESECPVLTIRPL